MSLRDRIAQVKTATDEAAEPEDGAVGDAPAGTSPEGSNGDGDGVADSDSAIVQEKAPAPVQPKRNSFLTPEVRSNVHRHIIKALGPLLYDTSTGEEEIRKELPDAIHEAFREYNVPLSGELFDEFATEIGNDVLGFGPLEEFLDDDTVTEIMVNGPEVIFVERAGKTIEVPSGFVDDDHVRRIIEKIVSQIGRRIDESSPMVDARLPDGSRVNAVIPPLAIDGPFLTIRKFSHDPFQIDDLINFGTLDTRAAKFLQACIVGKLNIIVSGGTGTGKTTLLNVLSSFIPHGDRVITVEDAKELQLIQRHVLCMETRPPNVEGRGEVTIRDLVKNSLRMRPDRIVVGECRGGEALDMLQAMNTGHEGSMTTVHANTPRDALSRIETLTLMAGFDLPMRAIREQMASAIDVVVQLNRMRDGSRRISHITEVEGMEGDKITMQDVYLFDSGAGVDEEGRYLGRLEPTGVRPKFAEKLADAGIKLGADWFGAANQTLSDRMAELR